MKVAQLFWVAATIAAPVLGNPSPRGGSSGLTVQTTEGPVQGALAPGFSSVRQFLGIPFAATTGGANRFTAPKPPPAHNSTLQATAFGPSCYEELNPFDQLFEALTGTPNETQRVTMSEDCLSLNIWTPTNAKANAVMIWVYGGAYAIGTTNQSVYDGVYFAAHQDIVLVTVNYRLNIFGSPQAPQLAGTSANFGLLDVQAAVQWVQKNIANFGGDPKRMVLFGQSAGAGTVDSYTLFAAEDPIIYGAITQSGSASGSPGNYSATAWNRIANATGCGTTANATQLACMRALPAATLEAAVTASNIMFSPTADGFTLFSNASARIATGQIAQIPLLSGNVANEGDIFVLIDELVAYNQSLPIGLLLSDYYSLRSFQCPVANQTASRVANGIPTYRYWYEAVFPDISWRPELRAYHTSEIPVVFATYNISAFNVNHVGPTANEVALSKYVQGAWAAFAKDPTNGLASYGWPRYDPNKSGTLVRIGNATLSPTGIVTDDHSYADAQCASLTLQATFGVSLLTSLGG